MLADDGCQDWWELTPDEFGSYVNGTSTQLASLPAGYSPLYHSSAVLPDGRVIIEGGEYKFPLFRLWTDQGAIYDPLVNTWTPGWHLLRFFGALVRSRERSAMPKVWFSSTERSCRPIVVLIRQSPRRKHSHLDIDWQKQVRHQRRGRMDAFAQ